MTEYRVFIGSKGNRVYHNTVRSKATAFRILIEHAAAMASVHPNEHDKQQYLLQKEKTENDRDIYMNRRIGVRRGESLYEGPCGAICS